ncbi:MAG: rod-binding protein [Lachnospiraceae bacterium]
MSISLDAMSSVYTQSTSASNQKAEELQSKLSKDLSSSSDEELMDVCKQFESYFTEMVFKEMEKSIQKEESTDSASQQQKDYYTEQLIQKWSEMSAESPTGTGLAKQLYQQLKRNYGQTTVQAADTNSQQASK